MTKKLVAALLLALVATPALLGAPAQAADPTRYASFTIGRGIAREAVGCEAAPGSVGVMRVAEIAASHGVRMGLNLVPSWLDHAATTGTRYCDWGGTVLHTTWGEAATLRDRYGWRHQTSGLTYRVITTLTPEEQRREACGALRRLREKGHHSASGLYAPSMDPRQRSTSEEAARWVRSECGFAWVRDYGQETWPYNPTGTDGGEVWATVQGHEHPAGYHRAISVNGGSCPGTWRCGQGGDRDYMEPELLLRHLTAAPPGSHVVFQVYRIVRGDQPGRWTCSGPSGTHATYTAEVYCLEDLEVLLAGVPDDYVVTDPLTVARRWAATADGAQAS